MQFIHAQAKMAIISQAKLQTALAETLNSDEVKGAIGKGPLFRQLITDYSDLIDDTVAIGFTLVTLEEEKSVAEKLDILSALDSNENQLEAVIQPKMHYIHDLL